MKLSPYPLPNKIHIAVYKVDNAVVVFCVLVAHATALHHAKFLQVHLDRFNAFVPDGSRQYQRVLLAVVGVGIYTVVHQRTLFRYLGYALQHSDVQCPVRNEDAEELAFLRQVAFLILGGFLSTQRQTFTFFLVVALFHQLVVFGFQVGRTNIFRTSDVLAHTFQQVNSIAPH